jgi:hypothetical protein
MALISNYTTLQTAIADYLNRSDLTTFLPNFTQACESKLYKVLRIRGMETALNVTIASGVAVVPADYVNTSPVRFLDRQPAEAIYGRFPVREGAGIPDMIAREAENFIFGPYPGGYVIKGIYYKRFPALSGSNLTNWFTTNAPDVLLYGSLLEAEAFIIGDPRIPIWREAFVSCIKIIQDEDRREGGGGSAPKSIYHGAK